MIFKRLKYLKRKEIEILLKLIKPLTIVLRCGLTLKTKLDKRTKIDQKFLLLLICCCKIKEELLNECFAIHCVYFM